MQALAIRLLGTPIEMRDYFPLLKWMILTGVALFGLIATWHFGLLQLMLDSDKSYISLTILIIYGLTSMHCAYHTFHISREINGAHRVEEDIRGGADGFRIVDDRVILSNGRELFPCRVTDHIHNLVTKSRNQGSAALDQTLLLRSLADSLKGRQQIGWFIADALLKLGLLGTIIGFILMLGPISKISAFDVGTMKDALSTMSGGMAVALFTTLAGLVGGTLLKVQYYLLDDGTAYLFGLATDLTEVHVVSVLDQEAHGQL